MNRSRLYERLSARETAVLLETMGRVYLDTGWSRVELVKASLVSELTHLATQNVELEVDMEILLDGNKVLRRITKISEPELVVLKEDTVVGKIKDNE